MTRRSTSAALLLLVGVFVLALAASRRVHAQAASADGDAPTFEVASVKANHSGDPGIRFQSPPGGRFTAVNAPVRELIRMAYQLQPFQIVNAPAWVDNDRFDVVAKAPADTPSAAPPGAGGPNTMQRMMQSLLADRFKLKAHRETREMPIYALVLARTDGKLGPKIEVSTTDCAALMSARARGAGAAPPPPLQRGERPQCGMFMGPGNVGAGDVSMTQFANSLGFRLQRSVIDRTGLTAKYSFSLEFAPEQLAFGPPGAPQPALAADPSLPSLFTALQEQLGLKLESQRGPVDVLVIERVDHPTED